MLKEEFEERYGSKYTLSRCREGACTLKDISRENYFIIDGDEIKNSAEKSVDCIIINLKNDNENNYEIILCELTTGKKDLKDAILKFKASGKLIIEYLSQINKHVTKIKCLLLGDIKENGKVIDGKILNANQFMIEGFSKKNIIQNESCGYSITKLQS